MRIGAKMQLVVGIIPFLSIQAQDFIEDALSQAGQVKSVAFLSIQAQDFIEDDWSITIA